MPELTLQGLTIENFKEKSKPVFLGWLAAELAKLQTDKSYAWISAIYERLHKPGSTVIEWGDLGTMPQWMPRMETEDSAQTELPIPEYILQYFEQYSSEYPISQEYFEEKARVEQRDELAKDYMQMLAQAAMDTRAALAVLPFLDAFDGNYYVSKNDVPLCGTHTLPGGSHTNKTDLQLSPEGLDAMDDSVVEVFTDQGIPVTFDYDIVLVGDLLYPKAMDIVTASGEYSGNQNVRNRYKDKRVVLCPWFRERIMSGAGSMWFGLSSKMLKFIEAWSLKPTIDVYKVDKNLTHYVRGRMKLTHGWKTPVGVFGSTGEVAPT